MRDLGEILNSLSPERRALLALRLKSEAQPLSQTPPMLSVPRDGDLPLSFGQERLWVIDQFEPGNVAYNNPWAFRLTGQLHVHALERSFGELVQRHESLRTVFPTVDGQPGQRILPAEIFRLSIQDLSGLPTEEREAEALRKYNEEAQCPFDLARGPLVSASLLRLKDDDHILSLTMHHIISDGWSFGVLVRELNALYAAFVNGHPSPLPAPTIQYADFACWQRRWLRGDIYEKQLNYWTQQLGGRLPIVEFPTDRPRLVVQTYRGAHFSFDLPLPLTEALRALSRHEGVTLFMVLLAAFKVLLFRYTGQPDIVIGSPIANRQRPETEGLIGFFVNTLVFRTTLGREITFRDLLRRIREVALGAYAHQDLPFERLVDALRPDRDLSRHPLFQIAFVLQNTPALPLELSALTSKPLEVETGHAQFDVTLAMRETEHGLQGTVEYNTDLFDRSTIARMVGNFETLLQGIVENPSAAVATLPLLSDAEHRHFQTHVPAAVTYAKSVCLQQLFEAQVQQTPEAIAVSYEDQTLSYDELNKRANILAHRLRAHGVGPDVIVALCVDRSLEMVIGILGILKAGGAYLPIDPVYPRDRLTFMLEDANVTVLVTQEKFSALFPATQATPVFLDGVASKEMVAVDGNAENPTYDGSPDNLAYVIYTSGSTGKPKGVLITHYNVVRLFTATDAWFHFGPRDVWTLFHSFAFDFSVWELWGPLLRGGRLVVVPYLVSRSPEAFYALLKKEHVTVLNQTPSAFRQLIQAEEQSAADPEELALRLVIFGGEALELQSLRPWFDRHGDTRPQLVNMYGITETTVHVTYRPITKADLDAHAGSVIGVPIPDLQLHLLDPNGQQVPVGVVGEIYVGGAGVARGYLNRPELTNERFVPNTFDDHADSRLYRSGDLARYLSNGDVEYLGRIDLQVKIRGFRIELGEIEAVLGKHALVRETVVIAREDTPGDKRLVAYIAADESVTIDELRELLRAHLPEYMVPSVFVRLNTLPLTPNGKVDRRALPMPDQARPELGQQYVAPSTSAEETLTQIWSSVLGIKEVGVQDNFFELGGQSLLLVQVHKRLQESLNRTLPIVTLFQYPTIRLLAQHLSNESAPQVGANDVQQRAKRQQEALARQKKMARRV